MSEQDKTGETPKEPMSQEDAELENKRMDSVINNVFQEILRSRGTSYPFTLKITPINVKTSEATVSSQEQSENLAPEDDVNSDQPIADVINGMNAAISKGEKTPSEEVLALREELDEGEIDVEKLTYCHMRPHQRTLDSLAREWAKKKMEGGSHTPESEIRVEASLVRLARYHRQLKQVLSFTIKELEGLACSSDKARTLISHYQESLLHPDKEMGDKGAWNEPLPGSHFLWMNLIEEYLLLVDGYPGSFDFEYQAVYDFYSKNSLFGRERRR